jgi:hypothetical protein
LVWFPGINRKKFQQIRAQPKSTQTGLAELPVGHGKRFGASMGRVANAFFGGWSLSGLFHWTTGLPFSVFVTGWSTNYNLAGEAIQVASPGKVGVYRDAAGNPNMFKDPIETYPEKVGLRPEEG